MSIQKSQTFVKMKNPYTFGVPVRGENFFGREEELRVIFDTLENVPRGQKQDLVVLGPRRIGKSSLLYRLVDLLTPHDEFVPVYVDLQSIKPRKTRLLFFKILRQIKKGYQQKSSQVALPDFETLTSPKIMPDFEFMAFADDFEALNDLIASLNLPRLVLIFDEVELLEEFGGLDTLGWFRSLIQSMRYTIFVVAGSERLYSLTQDYGSPFYNIFKIVELDPLTYQAAKNLLELPATKIGMDIYQGEIDKILQSTGQNPYLIQTIAHYLVEHLNSQKRRQIHPLDVELVIEKGVKYLEPHFTYIWNGTSQIQKIVLLALAKKGGPQNADALVSSVPDLARLIQSKKEQQEFFNDLVQQQIIFLEPNYCYWFVSPLFIEFITELKPEKLLININNLIIKENLIEIQNNLLESKIERLQNEFKERDEYLKLLIKKKLYLVLSDLELDSFTLDYFPKVYDRFSRGIPKDEKITLLLDDTRRDPSEFEKLYKLVVSLGVEARSL